MFPAKKTSAEDHSQLTETAPMNRRPLALLALVIASMVASACADISAPKGDAPCTGYTDSSGRCITNPNP
jgi:hypothetical protein